MKRDPKKVTDSWQMKTPNEGPADEAAIAFLLNQMATANSQRPLEVALEEKQAFGFDKPAATIEVKLKDQTTHRLVLGGKDPIESGVYAQVDPPTTESAPLKVDLVPTAFLDAVNRPLSEWEKQEDQDESTPSLTEPQSESTPSLPDPQSESTPTLPEPQGESAPSSPESQTESSPAGAKPQGESRPSSEPRNESTPASPEPN